MVATVRFKGNTLAIKARGPEERLTLLELLKYGLELKSSTDGIDGVEEVVFALVPKVNGRYDKYLREWQEARRAGKAPEPEVQRLAALANHMLMGAKNPAIELLRILPRSEERELFRRDNKAFDLRLKQSAARDPFS